MFKAFVGHSEDPLAAEAVRDVLDQIVPALSGLNPKAGLLFCSVDLDHATIVSTIRAAFPGIELAGCTTDGEVSSVLGFTEDSLILMVFVSDDVEIRARACNNFARNGKEAGRDVALAIRSSLKQFPSQERFAVILSDPLNAGISGVERGVAEVFGENFPIMGAASAAHSKRRKTFQFCNDEVLTDSVVLLTFAGPIVFSIGIMGGHAPMGGKERVTSVDKNILYQIEGKPALDYFRHYIGDKYDLFMNYCLAVYEEGRQGFYVRSAPFSDPEKGSVTLNGVVSEGSLVQIGTADKKTIAHSCTESVRHALSTYPGIKPTCAVFFSCAGRKMIMGTQIIQECQIVKQYLGDIPFCGFYSYGEFSPLDKGEQTLFHGTTFVSLLFGPAEES